MTSVPSPTNLIYIYMLIRIFRQTCGLINKECTHDDMTVNRHNSRFERISGRGSPKTEKRMVSYRSWGMALHCLHTVKQLVGRSMFLPAVEQRGADWSLLPPGRTAVVPEDGTGLSQ